MDRANQRDPTQVIKLVIAIFFACVLGGVYSNSGYSQKGVNNRIGILFVMTINQGFGGATAVLNSFPKEKVIVNRERSTGAYDSFSYYFAKLFVEAPLNLLPCAVFVSIIYFLVDLNPHRFGQCVGILMLEVFASINLGFWISAAAPNFEVANTLGIPAIIIALLFAGYYVNIQTLPIVANWIPYLSFIKWSFEALAINEFTGETFTCEQGATGSCLSTGSEVLSSLSYDDQSLNYALFGLGMVLLGFAVMANVSLYISKLSFISLGHVGRNRASEEAITRDDKRLLNLP